MAIIGYTPSASSSFPAVFQDVKYPKDIVINGTLYDIDTLTPKVGSRVMTWTGESATTPGTKVWAVDANDDDSFAFGVWNNDDTSMQYIATFAPNYPYSARDVKSDYTSYGTGTARAVANFNSQTHLWHRDWLDHPLKVWNYNSALNMYMGQWSFSAYAGQYRQYDGSNGQTCYQYTAYQFASLARMNIIDAETSSGLLARGYRSSAPSQSQTLLTSKYTDNAQLQTTTATTLLGSSEVLWIHHLTKCNNGDHFFLTHEGSSGVGSGRFADLLRYDNSADTLTVEYNNFATVVNNQCPFSVPSNVVYHQKTGDSSTSKKICYHFNIQTANLDNTGNLLSLIEMDVDNATITRTGCTKTFPTFAADEDDLSTLVNNNNFTTTVGGFYYYLENRIISSSQDINSRKYLMVGTVNDGAYSLYHDGMYMILKIDPSNPATLAKLTHTSTYGKWSDILTASSKNVAAEDIIPWCIAPLNTEHSLMMVFTKYSTHVLKFNEGASPTGVATQTLTEVWMDDNMVIPEVMWLPSGKVITSEYDSTFAQNPGVAVDFHAPRLVQVWAEDLIYNVDITPSANYVTYSGSDVSNTLTISAYDANNARVATDLTLKIIGPAVFSNSTTTKTITTSASADVTETITIQDNGHVEIQVLEVQTQ